MAACGGCGLDVPATARFCPECGLPAPLAACTACGEQLPPGARFCMECGTPVGAAAPIRSDVPVASRRVTSVLFGDLVGFTTLSEGRDQEDVRELLSRYFDQCRQVIARYGGTVEKFIGDAVMAVWGVPVTHEDDAERAVRAGLELVAAVAAIGEEVGAPGLAMRVGVVTGEVAVTVGATLQGMVAGDAVNTAARVQSAAQPGEVWVDDQTRLLTSAAISYLDAGTHHLKGKAGPVPLWSVRAVVAAIGGAQRADGLEAPLVGRDRELRLVKELFHHCEESARPALLVVDGDPGVGKSRLVWELEKYADGLSSTVRWHSGRCVAYGEGAAFAALAEAVRGRLRLLDIPVDVEPGPTTDHAVSGGGAAGTGDASEVEDLAALLERGLRRLSDDPVERDWLSPRLAALLGTGSVGGFAREDLFAAWVTFFERVADSRPVVLLVDDAQHADEGLLLFVEHLLQVAGFGCFVVLVTRPGLVEANPALATNRRSTIVHLTALPDADLADLVDGLVADLPGSVRDQLVARAEGLPLFAVETVRSLIDRDLVVPRGGRYVLADAADLDLDALSAPASLQALIAARLDTFSADQRRLVDRASVLGSSFPAGSITALCADLPDPTRTLAELVRLQVLSQDSSRTSAEYGLFGFVQSAVRQVAYASLSRRDRKALHLAVVAHLESGDGDADDSATVRARHYLDAIEAVPDADDVPALRAGALANLRAAAARARGLGANRDAARHLRVALGLVEEALPAARLRRELAGTELDAGMYDDAETDAARAAEVLLAAGERVEAAHATAIRGRALGLGFGDHEQALRLVDPWWEELRDDPAASRTLLALASVLAGSGTAVGRDYRDVVETRLRLAQRLDDQAELAQAYNNLVIMYSNAGVHDLARVLLGAAADVARTHRLPTPLAQTLINLTATSVPVDLTSAAVAGREAVQVADAIGVAFPMVFSRANLAGCLWLSGRWRELDALLTSDLLRGDDEVAREAREATDPFAALLAGASGGRWDGAYDPDAEASDDPQSRYWNEFLGSRCAAQDGDRPRALALALQAARTSFALTGNWDDLVYFWPVAAHHALEQHDDAALQELVDMLGGADPESRPPLGLSGHRRHVEALLEARDAGPTASVEAGLREAVEVFERWGAPPARARAQADLGRVLQQAGRHLEAEQVLAAARATYVEIGADAWLAELDAPPVGAGAPRVGAPPTYASAKEPR